MEENFLWMNSMCKFTWSLSMKNFPHFPFTKHTLIVKFILTIFSFLKLKLNLFLDSNIFYIVFI